MRPSGAGGSIHRGAVEGAVAGALVWLFSRRMPEEGEPYLHYTWHGYRCTCGDPGV